MGDYGFQGWAGFGPDSVEGNMKLVDFDPPTFEDDYVDVKVQYTGICASDTSQLAGHWGPYDGPIVCGHEIIGEVVRAGPAAGVKVGDRVGVGAQCDCCRECEWCLAGKDNFCPDFLYTFGAGKYSRGANKGKQNYGGFATHWRGPARFAIPVPAGLDPAQASSLMCAGMTVFAPLKRFGVPERAPRVGVLGIGGLGHMAIKIAKAMGAEVTAISRGEGKRAQATEMGADHYIATGEDIGASLAGHARSVDVVISTINPNVLDLEAYASLVKPEGTFCLVGIVPTPLQITAVQLVRGCIAVSGSNIASPAVIKELLQLAADKKIEPWITKWKWEDMNEAIVNSNEGKAKFRNVLVLEQNGGKM